MPLWLTKEWSAEPSRERWLVHTKCFPSDCRSEMLPGTQIPLDNITPFPTPSRQKIFPPLSPLDGLPKPTRLLLLSPLPPGPQEP